MLTTKPLRAALWAALLSASPSLFAADVANGSKMAQALFDYLVAPRTDIGADTVAQERWLAPDLRSELGQTVELVTKARQLPEMDGPDPAVPDNTLFLSSWDLPTKCEVSREDGADHKVVLMLCRWGPKTDYPGASRRYSVRLKREGNAYLVTDILAHPSKYASQETLLTRELRNLRAEARDWLTRRYKQNSSESHDRRR